MYEVKVNLNIIIPGRVMLSEKDCLIKVRRPLLFEKGKRKGEPIKDKSGNPIWHTTYDADVTKTNKEQLELRINNNQTETITFYTRKCKNAKRIIKISNEAYKYYISKEKPYNYKGKNWNSLSSKDKLEWHLNNLAASLGGIVDTYTVFED